MTIYQVRLTLTSEMLGATPKDRDIFSTHVQNKAREAGVDESLLENEISTVEEIDEKGRTGFHKNANGEPFVYDYVIRGFLKSACGHLRRADGGLSPSVAAYKKVIDGLIFVKPREIVLELPEGAAIGECIRSLRAETAQGARVALAASDTVPAGTVLNFRVHALTDVVKAGKKKLPVDDLLREWFDYGQYMGIGQWRSGGYGQFEFEMS